MDIDKEAYFWKFMDGSLPPPQSADTLGMKVLKVSPEEGTVEIEFEGKPGFANPVGNVQGGFLAAMLDDTMAPALAALLRKGEFAPTINLNISYARPGKIGKFLGRGRVLRRGRDVCFLAGELIQDDELIASATATALIRRP